MKTLTESEYNKLSQSEKDKHHAIVREELIKVRLITPKKENETNKTGV